MIRLSLDSLRRSLAPLLLNADADRRPELAYPLFPAPRMAVLGCEVRSAPGVHCLNNWTAAEVESIRPLALAASFPNLETLATMMRRGQLALPDLQYPLLVFSRPGDGALGQQQHDAIWSWFALPCFEQIRDSHGHLLAHECEARDGFHLLGDTRPSQIGGRLLHSLCECGQVSPRVRIAPAQALTAQAGD